MKTIPIPEATVQQTVCEFTIPGPPRTKKTSNRIVRAGAFSKVLPSKAFEEWNRQAQSFLIFPRRKVAAAHPGGIAVPLNCRALFYRDAERGDLCNYLQALCDALQEARIVANDKFICAFDGSRLCVDRNSPRIEFRLEVLSETAAEKREGAAR